MKFPVFEGALSRLTAVLHFTTPQPLKITPTLQEAGLWAPTIDNTFMLRQIFEKCYEYNIELQNIFVDYAQAFDSVNRKKL